MCAGGFEPKIQENSKNDPRYKLLANHERAQGLKDPLGSHTRGENIAGTSTCKWNPSVSIIAKIEVTGPPDQVGGLAEPTFIFNMELPHWLPKAVS